MDVTVIDGWTIHHTAVTESTNLDARSGQPGDDQAENDGEPGRPGYRGLPEQGPHIGAHRHEARVAQGQLPQIAGADVQGDGQDAVNAALDQHGLAGPVQQAAVVQHGAAHQQDRNQDGVDEVFGRCAQLDAFLHVTPQTFSLMVRPRKPVGLTSSTMIRIT